VVALVVTSLARARIPLRAWRTVHWLAYAAWPVALLHGAGMGTDAGAGWMLAVDAVCIAIFAGALGLRMLNAPRAAEKHQEPARLRVAR
jgi:methionine sulfoxide reductase heme-binding subunit